VRICPTQSTLQRRHRDCSASPTAAAHSWLRTLTWSERTPGPSLLRALTVLINKNVTFLSLVRLHRSGQREDDPRSDCCFERCLADTMHAGTPIDYVWRISPPNRVDARLFIHTGRIYGAKKAMHALHSVGVEESRLSRNIGEVSRECDQSHWASQYVRDSFDLSFDQTEPAA